MNRTSCSVAIFLATLPSLCAYAAPTELRERPSKSERSDRPASRPVELDGIDLPASTLSTEIEPSETPSLDLELPPASRIELAPLAATSAPTLRRTDFRPKTNPGDVDAPSRVQSGRAVLARQTARLNASGIFAAAPSQSPDESIATSRAFTYEALIASARRGDTTAMNELLSSVQLLTRNITGPILKDKIDTDDAAQRALVKVWSGLHDFRGNSDREFLNWVEVIAKRQALMILRVRKRTQSREEPEIVETEETEPAKLAALADPRSNPERALLRAEERRVLHSQLDEIERTHPKWAQSVRLTSLEGLEREEAAREMDVPTGTVASSWSRGIQELRGRVKPYWENGSLPQSEKREISVEPTNEDASAASYLDAGLLQPSFKTAIARHANTILRRIQSRRESGWVDEPLYSFYLLAKGSPTVLAQEVARLQFGDERSLVVFDMHKFNKDGSAAGLRRELTEKVRQRPDSVVYLQRAQDADDGAYRLFLDIMAGGFLEDEQGRPVDFRQTVFILGAGPQSKNVDLNAYLAEYRRLHDPASLDDLSRRLAWATKGWTESRAERQQQARKLINAKFRAKARIRSGGLP